MIALGKAIDGFLSSDVGKMTQAVVFAAFPEMKVVKDVAMPVLRQFIKKVTDWASSRIFSIAWLHITSLIITFGCFL